MPELTITDLYYLLFACAMVASFGHGYSAGYAP